MLAVVAPEAHDDPLSPLFEAQKTGSSRAKQLCHSFSYSGINKIVGKGGRYSRYVSSQVFCTQVEVIGIRKLRSTYKKKTKLWSFL